MNYDTATIAYIDVLEKLNLAFSLIFICEAIAKIVAFGLYGYF